MSRALLEALAAGDVALARQALAAGAKSGQLDLHVTDDRRRTPLHWAVLQNNDGLCAELLLAGFDINAYDADGRSPLHYCAIGGYPRIAWLIAHESEEGQQDMDINARDRHGRTALHACAETEHESDVPGVLIRCGADATIKDDDGLTAEEYARSKGRERIAQAIAAVASNVRRKPLAEEEREPLPF